MAQNPVGSYDKRNFRVTVIEKKCEGQRPRLGKNVNRYFEEDKCNERKQIKGPCVEELNGKKLKKIVFQNIKEQNFVIQVVVLENTDEDQRKYKEKNFDELKIEKEKYKQQNFTEEKMSPTDLRNFCFPQQIDVQKNTKQNTAEMLFLWLININSLSSLNTLKLLTLMVHVQSRC